MKKLMILLTEHDDGLGNVLRTRLSSEELEVRVFSEPAPVIDAMESGTLALIIIREPQQGKDTGLQIAERLRGYDQFLPILLIAPSRSEELLLAALRAGITDYFTVPFSSEQLLTSVHHHLRKETPGEHTRPSPRMIGRSSLMSRIKTQLLHAAPTDSTILISGETGTGKELAAELVHEESPRRHKPFICINCAALPEHLLESELFGYEKGAFTGASRSKRGGFELADGGTIFLDEIGDMTLCAQAKILRAIEKKEVAHLGGKRTIPLDFRVIAATNREPEQLIATGHFRKDLYYRLNVVRIHLPPLRERKEDIPELIEYLIRKFNRQFGRHIEGLTADALGLLLQYHWPGNVRELKNLLEATFINLPSRRISFLDLPAPFRKLLQTADSHIGSERDRMLAALFATNWNKTKAAQKLHWSRMTLYRKMEKYHISEADEAEPEDAR